MKRLNNTLIFLFTLASVCFFVKDINQMAYDRLLGDITVGLVLLLPRIIAKIFNIKITDEMELVYILFIILAQFFGSVVNLYNLTWWYDLFAHFLSGVLTSVLALVVMNWFGVYKEKNKWFNSLFIICFTLMVASIWEFIEFGSFVFLKMDVQHHLTTGVFDTMEDMLVAFLGSVIVVIRYLTESKKGNKGFLKKVVSDLK